ncbi:MAG: VOC family protein [Clostridiales bacterium]|nr:VOC family protein [Clostridiales bacterium]
MEGVFKKHGMKVHHIGISVPDLEETINWYSVRLGFRLIKRTTIPGLPVHMAHMQGPGFLLEIFEYEGAAALPEGRSHPNTDIQTHGIKHFSIGVDDARSFISRLEAQGVEVVFIAEVDGTYGAYILDNTGNLIEIFDNEQGKDYFEAE